MRRRPRKPFQKDTPSSIQEQRCLRFMFLFRLPSDDMELIFQSNVIQILVSLIHSDTRTSSCFLSQPFPASVFLVQPTAPTVNLTALSPTPSLQTCQRFSTSPQSPDFLRSIFHMSSGRVRKRKNYPKILSEGKEEPFFFEKKRGSVLTTANIICKYFYKS